MAANRVCGDFYLGSRGIRRAASKKYAPNALVPSLSMHIKATAQRYAVKLVTSPLAQKLLSDSAWTLFGNALAKGLTFLAFVLLTRSLGRAVCGEFGIVRMTADMFLAVSAMGVGTTSVKYISELLKTDKKRVGRIIALVYLFSAITSLVTCAVFVVFAPQICQVMLKAPHLTGELRIGMVMFFFLALSGAQGGVMLGFQDYKGMVISAVCASLVALPIYFFGAEYYGLSGAVVAAAIAAAINCLLNSIFIFRNTRKHQIHYAFLTAYKELGILKETGVPILLCGLCAAFSGWFSQTLIASRPGGMAEVGLFAASSSILTIMLFIPRQMFSVYLPKLGESLAAGNKRLYLKYAKLSLFTAISLSFGMGSCVALASPWIMPIFGAEFAGDWPILLVICLSCVFASVGSALWYLMLVNKMMWYQTWLCLLSYSLTILVTWLLRDYLPGAYAIAIGGCVTLLVCDILVVTLFRKKLFCIEPRVST